MNRILDQNPSQIFGQLNANGQVVLLNPNGVLFGSTASVNVGGLVATSLSIDPADFINGNYVFSDLDDSNGSIINYGLINASTGGSVTLLGEQVENHGLIAANLGSVTLAAGREAILTFDNDGLVGVKVTEAVLQEDIGVDPAVLNTGEIVASGGQILLTASVSEDIFSQAVNLGSGGQATDVVLHEDGSFTLGRTLSTEQGGASASSNASRASRVSEGSVVLGAGADVVNTGHLDASGVGQTVGGQVVLLGETVTSRGSITADSESGRGGSIELNAADRVILDGESETSAQSADQVGGDIQVVGDLVAVQGESVINVSGARGGGEVLIGGDYQGANDEIKNARRTFCGSRHEYLRQCARPGRWWSGDCLGG